MPDTPDAALRAAVARHVKWLRAKAADAKAAGAYTRAAGLTAQAAALEAALAAAEPPPPPPVVMPPAPTGVEVTESSP